MAKYREHFATQVLPALRQLSGFLGADLLSSIDSNDVEIIVMTRWQSLEAIRAFSGVDLEIAVVAEEVKPLFTQWNRRVQHYEMLGSVTNAD